VLDTKSPKHLEMAQGHISLSEMLDPERRHAGVPSDSKSTTALGDYRRGPPIPQYGQNASAIRDSTATEILQCNDGSLVVPPVG
jgi:hypothetical protein